MTISGIPQKVTAGIFVSKVNTTTTPLGAGATFTGTPENLIDYTGVDISLFGAPAACPGSLFFEFSPDGTNWDVSILVTGAQLAGPNIVPFHLRVIMPWFRLRYVNGGTIQTTFRLTTVYHRGGASRLTRFLNQTFDPTEGVESQRAALYAKSSNGSFLPLLMGASGGLNAQVLADLGKQVVHANATLTAGTSTVVLPAAYGSKEVSLIVNVRGPVTGGGTIFFTIEEVDPGDQTTVLLSLPFNFDGPRSLTAVGDLLVTMPITYSGYIKVTTVVSGGSSPSFGSVYATLVTRIAGPATIHDELGYKAVWQEGKVLTTSSAVVQVAGRDGNTLRPLSVDPSGRQKTVGAVANGAAHSGVNPVIVAGTDGTLLRTILTDANGRVAVSVDGQQGNGIAPSGNPVLVAGSDGSVARRIITDTSGRQVIVGPAADGAAVVGSPVLMGGQDGTNVQSMKTDTTGRPEITGAGAAGAPAGGLVSTQVPDTTASGTLNAANATVAIALAGNNSVGVQLTPSTYTATLVAELSPDGGGVWLPTVFVNPIDKTRFASLVLTATNTALYLVILVWGGTSNVRVRVAGGSPTNTCTAQLRTVTAPEAATADPIKRASYSASITALVPAATATDIFTIKGSNAGKIVRVTRIEISGTKTTAGYNDILLIKRSTADTGTSAAATMVPHDSFDPAATAAVLTYTANPTLGTTIGAIRSNKMFLPAPASVVPPFPVVWTWGDLEARAVTLRTTAEQLAVNLNSVTVTGGSFDIYIEWTEE